MKLNKLISLALVSALSLSLLTACAPKDEPATPDVEIPSVTTPDVETPDVETPDVETPDVETPDVDDNDTDKPVVDIPTTGDITLSITDFTLFTAGESHKIEVLNMLDSDTVTYRSSNEEVATVAEDGTVTAVAAGTATITADVLLDGITTVQLTAIVRCNIQEEAEEETPAPSVTLDFTAFHEELAAASEYQTGMMLGEGEMLTYQYPALADYNFPKVSVYMPMMSAVASELTFIQVADSADINDAKAVLQARIDAQVAGGAWYPATIEGWEKNSRIVSNGNYVMLVVAENADDVVSAFNAKF